MMRVALQTDGSKQRSKSTRGYLALPGLFALALAGCGGSGADYSDSGDRYDAAAEEDDEEARTEAAEAARQAAYEERGADSDGEGAAADGVDAGEINDNGNYVCTQDCSGHEAGFLWAQENDFTDAADCGGNSQSFIEGCEAFAEERQQQANEAAQAEAEEAAQAAYDSYEGDDAETNDYEE